MAGQRLVVEDSWNYFHLVRYFSKVCTLAEVIEARKTSYELRSSPFWLANFAVYEPCIDGALVTLCNDGSLNPFQKLGHPSELEAAMRDGELPLSGELSAALGEARSRGAAVRIRYADLNTESGAQLREYPDGTVHLEIDPRELARFKEHRPYFNGSQRTLLANLYGAPQEQGHMVTDWQPRTAVVLLSERYVRQQPRLFVRGGWVNAVNAGSIVEMIENFKENSGCILGVRRSV